MCSWLDELLPEPLARVQGTREAPAAAHRAHAQAAKGRYAMSDALLQEIMTHIDWVDKIWRELSEEIAALDELREKIDHHADLSPHHRQLSRLFVDILQGAIKEALAAIARAAPRLQDRWTQREVGT